MSKLDGTSIRRSKKVTPLRGKRIPDQVDGSGDRSLGELLGAVVLRNAGRIGDIKRGSFVNRYLALKGSTVFNQVGARW